jgi:Na+/melibiose symporter-like transporter
VLAAASPVWGWVLVGLVGAMVGGVSTLRWSLVPDLIDAASRDGPRLETSLIGLVSGAVQMGSGLAVAILGVLLGLVGYAAEAPTDADASLLAGAIGMVVACAHGLCALLSWLWVRAARAQAVAA